MSMELDSKLNSLVQLLISLQPKKIISIDLHTSLISRLNTLIFILKESRPEAIPTTYSSVLEEVLDEIKELLESLNEGSESIVQKFRNMLPGSKIKKLQSMIPRLLEVSDTIVTKASIYNTLINPVNSKRKADKPADEDLAVEIPNGPDAHKKIHIEQNGDDEVILLGTNKNSNGHSTCEECKTSFQKNKAFSIKMVVDPEIEKFFPNDKRVQNTNFIGTSSIAEFTIKREDFQALPDTLALRLSKDHAKVTATKIDKAIQYEISDLSVNGIYYLGNKIDGDFIKGKVWRIKKHVTYRLKHGDIIGLLMRKETGNRDMLIGFEFICEDEKK